MGGVVAPWDYRVPPVRTRTTKKTAQDNPSKQVYSCRRCIEPR